MSFSNSACSFILERDSIEIQSKFKERLVQIRDKQVRPLLEPELLADEKEILFTDAKKNLTQILQELLASG
jgi:hypothetical protein